MEVDRQPYSLFFTPLFLLVEEPVAFGEKLWSLEDISTVGSHEHISLERNKFLMP
jgi:hypothetical protein